MTLKIKISYHLHLCAKNIDCLPNKIVYKVTYVALQYLG